MPTSRRIWECERSSILDSYLNVNELVCWRVSHCNVPAVAPIHNLFANLSYLYETSLLNAGADLSKLQKHLFLVIRLMNTNQSLMKTHL